MSTWVEIDPDDFNRAIRLLHSRAIDSSDELKKLLETYCNKQASHDLKKNRDFLSAFSAMQSLNQDLKEQEKRTTGGKGILSDDDSETTDIEDNDLGETDVLKSALSCVVCKQIEITSSNQLFECQECRAMYHQDCHKPPITKKDISDPRFVWYCCKCSRNMKKISSQKPISSKSSLAKPQIGTSSMPKSLSSTTSTSKDSTTKFLSLKTTDSTDTKSGVQGTFKRVPGKFFGTSSTASKTSNSLSAIGRPTASALLNKSKPASASSSGPSLVSTNALDKRFPSLKKNKIAKYG